MPCGAVGDVPVPTPSPSSRCPHPWVSTCPRWGRRQWKRRAVARVSGLPQLLRQPGPGFSLLGWHGRQPLDRGESSPHRPRAATGPADGASPIPQGHRKSLGGSEAEAKPTKYCCVYLPDGTASLAAVRPGLSIRDMLAGICEKRGFSLPDIKVYLVGNEQVRGKGGLRAAGMAKRGCRQEPADVLALAESVGAGPGVLRAGGPGGEAGEQDQL